jgi:carbon-monoxide dehydrogenase catalytic subunit
MDVKNAQHSQKIIKMGIENYKNRGEVYIPDEKQMAVVGFTHESINYILGGRYRASYWPLNYNIINGRIAGLSIVGCSNRRYSRLYAYDLLRSLSKGMCWC